MLGSQINYCLLTSQINQSHLKQYKKTDSLLQKKERLI